MKRLTIIDVRQRTFRCLNCGWHIILKTYEYYYNDSDDDDADTKTEAYMPKKCR